MSATAAETKTRRVRKWPRRLLIALLAALLVPRLAFLALSAAFPFPQRCLDRMASPAAAPRVLDREGRVLQAFVSASDSWAFPVPLDAVSPRLVQATLAIEDKRFFYHGGVDAAAVARAAWSNLCGWRTVSGASTVTMQTVRLLEPRRSRSLWAKLVEAFRAVQLERLRSKQEILAAYLNLAPYGGNFAGAEAASLAWFRKHARDLTLGEAALLAVLRLAPWRLGPDGFPERAKARRDHVLLQMLACGAATPDEVAQAAGEPVSLRREPFPCDAPHLAQLVRQRYPGRSVLQTTLDPRVQHVAEAALDASGLSNGAVVVIENDAAALRALVGSRDFLAEDGGQVNGAVSPRSPGSALKPFTYALAFERGHCTPYTILADVPSSYTGYEPENYDRGYRGPVAARDALAASLNIPAVRLLKEVGHRNLHAFLRELGISTLTKDADHYGLALALGSVEVTLLDLTNAYAALARLGVYQPLRLLESEPVAEGRRVLSEGAAYLVADALRDTGRLGGRPLWKSERSQVPMAWKTGTSHGHRDAWTIAYTPRYTVGVWLGNFSGRPARELVGVEAAAPIAARIFDQIETGPSPAWFRKPESVGPRRLCAVSGMAPGPSCSATVEGLCLTGSLSERPCTVHVTAKVDQATGVRLCPRCIVGHKAEDRVFEAWPVELAAWLGQHGRGEHLLPAHNSQCSGTDAKGGPPRIVSPAADQTLVLLPEDDPGRQRLALKASGHTAILYWFVDGSLFATCPQAAGEPLASAFWPLSRGRHVITCSDDAGRSASVNITVQREGGVASEQ